ncbi:MAG: transglutaminase domain-containing protein [bacterium]|nr:transglutaminase domain-containing protein [bacterium]
MKLLLIMLVMLFNNPMREVEDLKLAFHSQQYDIFLDYSNDNFSQKLDFNHDSTRVTASIKSSNYLDLNLNFRVFPDKEYIESLSPQTRDVIRDLLAQDESLKTYLLNISYFLQGNIKYSDDPLPQDAVSVLSRQKAYCIGYSNVVKMFLDSVKVKSRLVKGFYLKKAKRNKRKLVPVPHRWLEIILPNDGKFFYDPQYQKFSVNYITTKNDTDFKRVKKFRVRVIDKSKQIVN